MPTSKNRYRTCQLCGKPYELGVDSTQHKYCSIKCRSIYHNLNGGRKYRRSDKGKAAMRRWHLKTNFKISPEEFDAILLSQNSRCAVCETETPTGYNWHVDHCHITDKVRGILCSKCNQGLGLFGDNPVILNRARKYLENS